MINLMYICKEIWLSQIVTKHTIKSGDKTKVYLKRDMVISWHDQRWEYVHKLIMTYWWCLCKYIIKLFQNRMNMVSTGYTLSYVTLDVHEIHIDINAYIVVYIPLDVHVLHIDVIAYLAIYTTTRYIMLNLKRKK